MKVLGLDTSTETGGVALLDGERLVAEYTLSLRRTTHSERLMPAVRRVLKDGGRRDARPPVEGVAVAQGPGSYTGLRIGVVTAKALAYGWDVPVVGVSTLAALAYQAGLGADCVCVLMDARRGAVYGAVYDTTGPAPEPVVPPARRDAAAWLAGLEDALRDAGRAPERIVFTGDGVGAYPSALRRLGGRAIVAPTGFRQLRPAAVAALGRARLVAGFRDDPMALTPVYLRKSEAERQWEQRERKPSPS